MRKKRKLWPHNGEKICEECLDAKIFDETLRNELLSNSDVRIVAMEHGVFTERHPNLRVYLATMQAMNWLLHQEVFGSNKVELDDLAEIVQGYAADLMKEVIPVLQKVNLLGDIKEEEVEVLGKKKKVKFIYAGDIFQEISDRWKGKQKDQALYLLHGLVSSGSLSETHYRSGVKRTFVNAILDEFIDQTTGDIDKTKEYYEIGGYECDICGESYSRTQKQLLEDHLKNDHAVPAADVVKHVNTRQVLKGYLLSQDTLETHSQRNIIKFKSLIDKLYTFIRYNFIFYEKEPTITRGGKTYWVIKPEWVKVLSKTKIKTKDHIKQIMKMKGKGKGKGKGPTN